MKQGDRSFINGEQMKRKWEGGGRRGDREKVEVRRVLNTCIHSVGYIYILCTANTIKSKYMLKIK